MAYAIAAMAWDAADVSCSERSSMALQMVDAEIMALMTSCTLYHFATKYSNVMLRYVYLRRALLRGPCVATVRGQQLNYKLTHCIQCPFQHKLRAVSEVQPHCNAQHLMLVQNLVLPHVDCPALLQGRCTGVKSLLICCTAV